MATPATPQSIGPYALEHELGRGGMGVVYAARGPDGRPVALKLMLPGSCGPEGFARFVREGQALAGIRHPHLVACLGAGEYVGSPYLVMERVEGMSLDVHLREAGTLSPDEAIGVATQIARGLATLHEAGLVHRDVKPENVLVTAEGQAKLADLGLVTGLDFSRLTATQEVVGTPAYMAPEQVLGQDTSPATDVYAMGVLLYELLSGTLPFRAPNPLAMFTAQVRQAPPSVRSSCPGVSPELERLVAECLQKAPEDRPAHGRALVQRLEGLRATGDAQAARGRGLLAVGVALLLAFGGVIALVSVLVSRDPEQPAAVEPSTPGPEEVAPQPAQSEAWKHFLRVEFARAETLAREELEQAPRDPEAHLRLGRVLMTRLKYWEALGSARAGLELAPDSVGLLTLEQSLWFRFRRREEEAQARARLESLEPDGVAAALARLNAPGLGSAARWDGINALIAEYPNSLRAHVGRISQEASSGRGDAKYEASLLQFPDEAPLLHFFRVQGLQYGHADQEALDTLRARFPDRADNPDLLCIEAELLQNLGRSSEAIERAELACELDPGLWRAWIWVAKFSTERGDLERARSAAREALAAVAPADRWRFVLELGQIALVDGDHEEALKQARAVEGGENPQTVRIRARLEATALRHLGRIDEAIRALERWAGSDPRDPYAFSELAKYNSAAGNHEEAERCASRSLELDPTSGVCWELLGGARFSLQAPAARVEQPLLEALRLGRDSAKLRLILVRLYFKVDRLPEAREQLDAGLGMRPSPELRQTFDRFDQALREQGH